MRIIKNVRELEIPVLGCRLVACEIYRPFQLLLATVLEHLFCLAVEVWPRSIGARRTVRLTASGKMGRPPD